MVLIYLVVGLFVDEYQNINIVLFLDFDFGDEGDQLLDDIIIYWENDDILEEIMLYYDFDNDFGVFLIIIKKNRYLCIVIYILYCYYNRKFMIVLFIQMNLFMDWLMKNVVIVFYYSCLMLWWGFFYMVQINVERFNNGE